VFLSSAQIVVWLMQYQYLILFPIAILEWPIVSILAGFLVSKGQMQMEFVLVLLVMSDLIGDVVLYFVWKRYGVKLIKKYGYKAGISEPRYQRLCSIYDTHAFKLLIFGKVTHTFGMWFLLIAGIVGISFRKFLRINLLANIPKTIIFLIIWYYFGKYYGVFDVYMWYYILLSIILVGIILLSGFLSTKKIISYLDTPWK